MSLCDRESSELIPNSIGELKTQILVGFDEHDKVLIGKEAKYSSSSVMVIDSLEYLAGRTFDEIVSMKQYPFRFKIKNKYNKPYIKIKTNDMTSYLTIEEILTYIFTYLKTSAESFLNSKVFSIALTVPDDFSESQLLSIKAGANLAGLRIVKSSRDAISAIYSYEINETEEDINVLVIDIAEDSTNLVVVSCDQNGQEVIGTHVISNYGSRKFSRALEDYLLCLYQKMTETKLKNKKNILHLKREVKYLQAHLTTSYLTEFRWNSIGVDVAEVIPITRAKYDELISETIFELEKTLISFLKEIELKRSDIAQIVLLGSSFSIPKLQKEIRNFFYNHELRSENGFDEAPAIGIGKIGLQFGKDDQINYVVLPDILYKDISIEVYGSMSEVIIERGLILPNKKSKNFTLNFDSQIEIIINVLEGDKLVARRNTFLGQIEFRRPPTGLRGLTLFNIEIAVESNGYIFVTATDLETKIQKRLVIRKSFERINVKENSMPNDEHMNEKDRELEIAYKIREEIEDIAYEIRGHILQNSSFIQRVKSPIDLKILKESVNEIIEWFAKYSYAEIADLENVKKRFEANIKPILQNAFHF